MASRSGCGLRAAAVNHPAGAHAWRLRAMSAARFRGADRPDDSGLRAGVPPRRGHSDAHEDIRQGGVDCQRGRVVITQESEPRARALARHEPFGAAREPTDRTATMLKRSPYPTAWLQNDAVRKVGVRIHVDQAPEESILKALHHDRTAEPESTRCESCANGRTLRQD